MVESNLQVTEINHVVLHVSDLERSRNFYMDVLGFEDRSPSFGGPLTMSFLGAGHQGLDLFEMRGQDVHGGQEMNHMALAVVGADLDEVCSALERAGVDASEKTPRNTVMVSDPDGHRIEILPRTASLFKIEREPSGTD